MVDRLLADVVVSAHFLYIAFVMIGGLAVLRRPRLAWLHLPAAAWGAAVELFDLPCPLTPLENHFRARAGLSGYEGDFLQRHLLGAIYPTGLTRTTQLALAALVLTVNVAVYARLWVRLRGTRAA